MVDMSLSKSLFIVAPDMLFLMVNLGTQGLFYAAIFVGGSQSLGACVCSALSF